MRATRGKFNSYRSRGLAFSLLIQKTRKTRCAPSKYKGSQKLYFSNTMLQHIVYIMYLNYMDVSACGYMHVRIYVLINFMNWLMKECIHYEMTDVHNVCITLKIFIKRKHYNIKKFVPFLLSFLWNDHHLSVYINGELTPWDGYLCWRFNTSKNTQQLWRKRILDSSFEISCAYV